MKLLNLDQIERCIDEGEIINAVEQALVDYSAGRAVVPPVGELLFEDPPGETHIKYGYITGQDEFVVKVASGFYRNPDLGLPSSSGVMLVFSQQTGMLKAVLLDEGRLTDIRTAAAGAVAAKHLAPSDINMIRILGTGIQARLQLQLLKHITPCRQVAIWGRNTQKAEDCRAAAENMGFSCQTYQTPDDVAEQAQIIVTTTPSTVPLLRSSITHGAHITAVGADTPEKCELASDLVASADLIVCDSVAQCTERGETRHALASGALAKRDLFELGTLIAGNATGRTSNDQFTVCDLTGVAVQDLAICRCILTMADRLGI